MEVPDFVKKPVNFDEQPFIVIWETTQACDLACVHCRACAQPLRDLLELSTKQAKKLIDDIVELKAPVFVMTGGDPLKRPDIFELVSYCRDRGVRASLTPSATPLLTKDAIRKLKDAGLTRLAISLDGSVPELHDKFRQVDGSYQCTLNAVRWAREIELPVQINTTITRHNLHDLDNMIALMEGLDIVLWSVFFLVPTGRGSSIDLISAEEFEQVFEKLYRTAQRVTFDIKSTEAQHYRRFLLQKRVEERKPGSGKKPIPFLGLSTPDGIGRAPKGINDGKGFVFVSHRGEVYPSGFLPISGGNIRKQPLAEIYRNSPLFKDLRDASKLEGKCGRCEFRELCGGSRARAYALTGNAFAEEPCCTYEPKRAAKPEEVAAAAGD
jgi:radical SAM protein